MIVFYTDPIPLVSTLPPTNNDGMIIPGRVHNGVVVLEGGPALPEGAAVSIWYPVPIMSAALQEKRRIEIPLVRSEHPGSVRLTGERIAEILNQKDASPGH